MLGKQGYIGTKTGITDAAGPCLSAAYENGNDKFVVILLNSKTMDHRWQEVPKLIDWAISRKNRFKEINSNNNN